MLLQDIDLLKAVGAGWSISDQETITAQNQSDHLVQLDASCALAKVAAKVGANHAPPIGWHWVAAQSADGDWADLWIEPGGKVWNVGSCGLAGQFTAASAGKGASSSGWLWVLLGGLGLGAVYLAGKKGKR